MASKVLYAPVINSYMPAFNKDGSCTVFYSLSKFNGSQDIAGIQVAIMKQGNSMTVVNPIDDDNSKEHLPTARQRSNGRIIIMNDVNKVDGEDNLYYVNINNKDIKNGWTLGWIYKIQIRLSEEKYEPVITQGGIETLVKQESQLNDNAYKFSEQSTVCVTKAIGEISLKINPFPEENKEDKGNEDSIELYYDQTMLFSGRMLSTDTSEKLYMYRLKLYNYIDGDEFDELIEDSGELYSNQYQNTNDFNYFIKKELKDGRQYRIVFEYVTNNGYSATWEKVFEVSYAQNKVPSITILTAEDMYANSNSNQHVDDIPTKYDTPGYKEDTNVYLPADPIPTVFEDEEEGRISIKLVDLEDKFRSGNYCIRRTDEYSNFKDWIDIKIIIAKNIKISTLPLYYDYTVESGVGYKYALQEIDRNNNRSLMREMSQPVIRDFQFSYLLGEGGKQLKLKFDNTMQSFKIQQSESKIEPIGNKYPTITRNAAIEYKTFPIAGLISYQMDDAKLFCTKDSVYKENAQYHKKYNSNGVEIKDDYDFTQERDFRNTVIKFLQNGKPKLFKSPTEGNIIVRLMDINCTPNQTLDRMIYSFTANANEIAEANVENYLKYNFYKVGEPTDDFAVYETKLGQLSGDFHPTDNIVKKIQDKYTNGNQEIAGYIKNIQKVYQIRITINDKPLRVQASSGEIVLGHNIQITGKKYDKPLTIYNGVYDFDSRFTYTSPEQGLYLLGDANKTVQTVNATIDFLYDSSIEEYLGKKVDHLKSMRGVGQIFGTFKKGQSIRDEIFARYFMESELHFCNLNRLWGIEIEANPGTKFEIRDSNDPVQPENPQDIIHIINQTGVLRLYDIDEITEVKLSMDNADTVDVIVTYYYTLLEGDYKE